MDLSLHGRTAVITAASYGIGFACAEALALEGVTVCICSRDAQRAEDAAREIERKTGTRAFGVKADIVHEADREELFRLSLEKLGHIDILVLSTGHPPTVPLSKASNEDWDQGINLLLKPVISMSKKVIPSMCERHYGRLIFIGSIFGLEPEASSIIQSTLRTGLNAFSKCIATSYAEKGVTANVVCPGYIETPLLREVAKGYATGGRTIEDVLESWKEFAPVKSFGRAEDLGTFVAFLASPRAAFLTGTSLAFDGGALRNW